MVFIPIESNVVVRGKDDAVCVEDRPTEVEEEEEERKVQDRTGGGVEDND